jgi:antitoxin ChpS
MGRKETEEAIADSRAGRVKRFASVEELLADLHADDDKPGGEMLRPFDPAEALTTAVAISTFLADAEATADPEYIEHARAVAARAKVMHSIK